MSPMRYLVLIILLVLTATAQSQESVSRKTFVALQKIEALVAEEQFDEALEQLEALAVNTAGNSYDNALVHQYLAHTSVQLDNPARARTALETALAVENLPDDLLLNLYIFYGTILLGDDEFELGREVLAKWYALETGPTPTQIFSFAYATYMSDDVPGARPLLERAIGDSSDPKQSWYQLYYRVLFDMKDYELAEDVLKGMIAREPGDENNWRMLASHYLQLEESADGLAAMMIAYNNELIESEADLKQLASLWGYIDVPEKGARLLDEWIRTEKIEGDADMLKQLGNLWLMSRERDNAIGVLTRAAELAPDGRTYELLGGVFFEEEKWDQAYTAYMDAIETGGLEEPLRVSLLAGISAFNGGNNENAREALDAAAASDSEELREQAESVLRELD
ncbi:MAG: tetratricopeptide repeat protein [Woeseiaceae bacterium]